MNEPMFESDEERRKDLEKTDVQMIFWRSFNSAEKDKLSNATNRVIDVLRKELKLEPFECLIVVRTLYQEFPLASLNSGKAIEK